MSAIDQADRLLMDKKQPTHLPGPWRVEFDADGPRKMTIVTAADGYQMCAVDAPTDAQLLASAT